MATTKFVPFWKEGKDSFLSDPPNASLSILGEDKATEVTVELRDPVLKGNKLSYDVRVLQGELPAKGGVTSLIQRGSNPDPQSAVGGLPHHPRRGIGD